MQWKIIVTMKQFEVYASISFERHAHMYIIHTCINALVHTCPRRNTKMLSVSSDTPCNPMQYQYRHISLSSLLALALGMHSNEFKSKIWRIETQFNIM